MIYCCTCTLHIQNACSLLLLTSSLPNQWAVRCRCGSASHLGVQWNIPTVGVGKTLLQWDGLNERHVRDTIGRGLEALKEGHDLPAGCYTETTPRGESVACMHLIGEGSDDVLGVAVAGMHATQRPIYVSRGERYFSLVIMSGYGRLCKLLLSIQSRTSLCLGVVHSRSRFRNTFNVMAPSTRLDTF